MALTTQLQRSVKSGIISDAVQGLGVGTIVNVIDKKALQGKLTAAGVSIGQTLNGKPLCLNVTDVITYMLIAGTSFKKGALMKGGISIAVKKFAEAFDYIDPPVTTASQITSTPIYYPATSYATGSNMERLR